MSEDVVFVHSLDNDELSIDQVSLVCQCWYLLKSHLVWILVHVGFYFRKWERNALSKWSISLDNDLSVIFNLNYVSAFDNHITVESSVLFICVFLPSLGGWRECQGWGGVDPQSSSPVPLYPGQCSRTVCHSGIIALQNLPGHCSLMFSCCRWSTVRRVPWGTVSTQGCTKTWTGSGGCSGRSSRDWFTSTNKSVTSLVLHTEYTYTAYFDWTVQIHEQVSHFSTVWYI